MCATPNDPKPLTVERWKRIEIIFHETVTLPEPARSEKAHQLCANDNDLFTEVKAVLRGHDQGIEPAGYSKTAIKSDLAGRRFGNYQLDYLLGQGGMGSVYLAHRADGEFEQQVALKVLGAHLRTDFFTERFRLERQILAQLNDIHITRLLDSGVSENGDPYLVMEYVNGQSIDDYCENGRLTVNERITLFLQVCNAVAYAHRRLIIHRDIKPSNIFVTADGTAKLLDFGTAKLFESAAKDTTAIGFRMMTPRYASPEELRGESVTTLSDVYSLGVVLFELLTGAWPFGEGQSMIAGLERAMREIELPRPSVLATDKIASARSTTKAKLADLLSGDLANLLVKSVQSDPTQRYTSADQLAEDLQRYQNGQTLLAKKQTAFYLFRKWVARNRGRVAASLVLLLAVVGSLAYAFYQQTQAIREGRRALVMQTFMYRLLQTANSNYTGKPAATVKEFLELGVKVLPEYIVNATDLRQAQLALAESMFANHDCAAAEQVCLQVAKSAKEASDVSAEAEALAYAGHSAYNQGHQDVATARTATSLALSRKAGVPPRTRVLSAMMYASEREDLGQHTADVMRLFHFAVDESRKYNLPPHEIGQALSALADAQQVRGSLDEARQNFEAALAVNRQDPLALCDQANILYGIAGILQSQGETQEAIPVFHQAYDRFLTCGGPEDTETLRMGAYYAGALVRAGRAAEALPLLQNALPIWRKVFPTGNLALAEELYFLSLAYLETHHYDEAARLAKEQIDLETGRVDPKDRRLGVAHYIWGKSLAGQARYAEALPHAQIAATLLRIGAVSVGARARAAQAEELMADLQKKSSRR